LTHSNNLEAQPKTKWEESTRAEKGLTKQVLYVGPDFLRFSKQVFISE
jgi:hypothetical protein